MKKKLYTDSLYNPINIFTFRNTNRGIIIQPSTKPEQFWQKEDNYLKIDFSSIYNSRLLSFIPVIYDKVRYFFIWYYII